MPVRLEPSPDVPRREIRLKVPGFVYIAVRLVVHVVNRLYWRVTVSGASVVPGSGAVILAPVHRNFMDFFVVTEVTKRKIFYMAKDDLWRNGALGAFLDAMGAFPVNRDGPDRLALDRAQAVLEHGDVLILFPEGTRREGPVVADLHEGAAFLAARTGAPVVPIGIGGSARIMPKGAKVPRPTKVHIDVGDVLEAPARSEKGRVPRSQVHAFTLQLGAEIQRLYDRAQTSVGIPAHDTSVRRVPTDPGDDGSGGE
ncbi:MAG TPA: lysophospholipid acyltransferase family protein [Acidimicrobiales bacterium]|nr:lysophospholipid acyltransferase family protein [Acidimicrobiales bacterium]